MATFQKKRGEKPKTKRGKPLVTDKKKDGQTNNEATRVIQGETPVLGQKKKRIQRKRKGDPHSNRKKRRLRGILYPGKAFQPGKRGSWRAQHAKEKKALAFHCKKGAQHSVCTL